MRRLLLLASLVGATWGASPSSGARACLLAAPGRPPAILGLRVVARRITDGADRGRWQVYLFFLQEGAPEGQSLGLLLPLPAGVQAAVDPGDVSWYDPLAFTNQMEWETQPSILVTRETTCQGCEEVGGPLRPWETSPALQWQRGWDRAGSRLEVATDPAQLDAWLDETTFVLSPDTDAAVRATLAAGDSVALIRYDPLPGARTAIPIRLIVSGVPRLPLSWMGECAGRPTEVTLFVAAEAPARVTGWPVAYLDELDHDLMRGLVDRRAIYRRVAKDAGGEQMVIEGVWDLDDPAMQWLLDEDGSAPMIGTRGVLTRMGAWVDGVEISHDLEIDLDPQGRRFGGMLDLRPDPQAHGTSISGEWFPLGALVLFLLDRRRRRYRSSRRGAQRTSGSPRA